MDLYTILISIKTISSILGIFYVGKALLFTLYDIAIGLRAHVYSKFISKDFLQLYGKWAVVTGCTDGIGKAYSEELAKRGLNLVLVSRNMTKLNNVASQIEKKYGVKTEVVQVDFSHGRSIYEKIPKHLKGKEIGMLINNVGVGMSPKNFEQLTEDEIWEHVNVNVGSISAMAKLILPQMLKRKKGAIVNLSSISSLAPLPYMSIYAATKIFISFLSEALESECGERGVTVQTVTPSFVATNMTSFSSLVNVAGLITPSPSRFAYHAVSTIGYTKKTAGYWVHGIQAWISHKLISINVGIYVGRKIQEVLMKDMAKSKGE